MSGCRVFKLNNLTDNKLKTTKAVFVKAEESEFYFFLKTAK